MATVHDHTDWNWSEEVTDPTYGPIGSGNHLDPAHGDFVWILWPPGKWSSARTVEISIRPWDERPGVTRTIYINAWQWGGIPPLIPKPDWFANEDCRQVMARVACASPETP